MGIEPTSPPFQEGSTGFEDRGRHQHGTARHEDRLAYGGGGDEHCTAPSKRPQV